MRKNKLKIYLDAKDPLIYVVTYEELVVMEIVKEYAAEKSSLKEVSEVAIYEYSVSSGMYKIDATDGAVHEKVKSVRSSLEALQYVCDSQNLESVKSKQLDARIRRETHTEDKPTEETGPAIFVFKDLYLEFNDIRILRLLRDIKEGYKEKRYCPIIITAPVYNIPSNVSKLFTVYELPLLTKDEVYEKLSGLYNFFRFSKEKGRRLAEAATGLTERELQRTLAHSFAINNMLTVKEEDIFNEKIEILKNASCLDFLEAKKGLTNLGGCDNFKSWIKMLKFITSQEAKEIGIPSPKGVMLLGIPGTSKSVCAEIIAKELEVPLLALNMSKIMGALVGESERNIAHALQVARSIAPCVLLIDEVEKALGGINSSNSCDGGALARVMAQLLSFLQAEDTGVFTVMTSNDVTQLPPELSRSGRIDTTWFFDLPTEVERKEILELYLKKQSLSCNEAMMSLLLERTNNFTGAEIEVLVKNMLVSIFMRQKGMSCDFKKRQITEADINSAINLIVPIYKANWEKLADFRNDAKVRYLAASSIHEEKASARKQTMILQKEKMKNV